MDASMYTGGRYLKKEDLGPARSHSGTIRKVFETEMDEERKLALIISGLDKALLLNATNIKRLIQGYGTETNGWAGKPITVYVDDEVMMKGQIVGGLRVRVTEQQAAAAAPAQAASEPADKVSIRKSWEDYAGLLDELVKLGDDIGGYELPPTASYAELVIMCTKLRARITELKNKPEWTARKQATEKG